MLEGALQARPDAPYSCMGGACGTCRAKLLDGTVEMDHNFALGQDELDAGLRAHLPVAPHQPDRHRRLRRPRMNLGGRLALVTGASTGIGAATARALAGRGARVALVARSSDKLESLAAQIGEGALACPTDVSDHHAVAQMAERIRAEEGVPDVLVNNAGAGRFLFIEETSPEGARPDDGRSLPRRILCDARVHR